MAAQLIGTNGLRPRGERECSRRATISFPVPLSPSTRTVASLVAARATALTTPIICGLVPTMASLPFLGASGRGRSRSTE